MNNEEKILSILERMEGGISTLKTEVVAIRLDIENRIDPQLQTLAEGIVTINEKLVARSEMESLKEELFFLKDIIRMHTTQINDLKSAI